MISQDEVSRFRQWGMQSIDTTPVLPLNLITLEGAQYQFLDCLNGSNKSSDYWEQHSTRPDIAEADDRENHVTFLACPLGPLEYRDDFWDGEYPVGTIQHVYYKPRESNTIQRIFESLKVQDKDPYDIAARMTVYLEKAVVHMHLSGVFYILQHVSVATAMGPYGTEKMLNVMLSTQQEKENEDDIRMCFIMLPVHAFLTSIYMTVSTQEWERDHGCIQ